MLGFIEQRDKQLHIAGSAILTIVIYLLAKSLVIAGVGALVVGIGKEVYDYYHPEKHTADIKDILADCVGIAVAIVGIYYAVS